MDGFLRFDDCVAGGESRFQDLFHTAERFRRNSSKHFEILTRIPATFQKIHYSRYVQVLFLSAENRAPGSVVVATTAVRGSELKVPGFKSCFGTPVCSGHFLWVPKLPAASIIPLPSLCKMASRESFQTNPACTALRAQMSEITKVSPSPS